MLVDLECVNIPTVYQVQIPTSNNLSQASVLPEHSTTSRLLNGKRSWSKDEVSNFFWNLF